MKKIFFYSVILIVLFSAFKNDHLVSENVNFFKTFSNESTKDSAIKLRLRNQDYLNENTMKTILVDAVNAFVVIEEGINQEMFKMLEAYPNKKIILTGANDEQIKKFGLDEMPYEVFTLKHNPEKTSPTYYKTMLKHFNLNPNDVIYFEHNLDAVKSAESIGIKTFHYDMDKRDIKALKQFIDKEL